MDATLADAITTTTNGPYAAVQIKGATEPVSVEIVGKALGTSGAFSVTFDIEESADASSFSAVKTVTVAGTAETKPIALQHVARKPWVRLNVTAISGTGASLSAALRV